MNTMAAQAHNPSPDPGAPGTPGTPGNPGSPGNRKPVIGITMGDPAGIGPEVIVKALADPAIRKLGRFIIFGMNELLAYAADLAELDAFWWRLQHDSPRATYDLVHDVVVLDYDEFSMLGSAVHRPTKQGGQASLRFLDDAIAAAQKPYEAGGIDALVTAPISKEPPGNWRAASSPATPSCSPIAPAPNAWP